MTPFESKGWCEWIRNWFCFVLFVNVFKKKSETFVTFDQKFDP